MVKTQFGVKIEVFRTDNSGEFFSDQLGVFLTKHGIVHQSSCTNTPQQNRIAERKKPTSFRSN